MQYSAPENFLKNRIILVTGAGDGIGKATAMSYAAHGATVILCGRNQANLETVYDAIESAGHAQPALLPINFESATPKDYYDMAQMLTEEFGHLDGLLVNAGWLGNSAPIAQYDIELWYRVMQINLNAPFMLCQALIPLLLKSANASVVFSVDEKDTAYWGAYGVSKAGLISLMKILADEHDTESNRIRVNAVNPGAVRTKLRTRAYPGEDPALLKTPDEILSAYLYLMGDDSKTVTGEVINAQ